MFDIGFPELFIVAVLGIIFVGPKDLPKVIRGGMNMLRKVREMGREFQDGVKKMADEVELDEVTRKLNEAGNISLDDASKKTLPDVDHSGEFSDYEEFDYDAFDYEDGGYDAPSKPDIKTGDDKVNQGKTSNKKPTQGDGDNIEVVSKKSSKTAAKVKGKLPIKATNKKRSLKVSTKKNKKSKSVKDE